jgi:hypothetical protein
MLAHIQHVDRHLPNEQSSYPMYPVCTPSGSMQASEHSVGSDAFWQSTTHVNCVLHAASALQASTAAQQLSARQALHAAEYPPLGNAQRAGSGWAAAGVAAA